MSTSSKVKSMLVKPIIVGLVSALGAKVMNQDYSVTIPYIGTTISGPVFYGLLGTASSLATETVHTWVLPYLPQSASAVKAEAALLSPAIHAALNVGVLTLGYRIFFSDVSQKMLFKQQNY
jgi:hypothetical protein